MFNLPSLGVWIEGLDYSAPSPKRDPFPLVAALPYCEKGPGDVTNLPIKALDCPLGGEGGDSLCAFIGDGVPSGGVPPLPTPRTRALLDGVSWRGRVSGGNGLGGTSVQYPPDMGSLWGVSLGNTRGSGYSGYEVGGIVPRIQVFEKQDFPWT